MRKVEADRFIKSMLEEELERCQKIISLGERKLSEFPKGKLIAVIKQAKSGKRYEYHSLVYRENMKPVSKYVKKSDVEHIEKLIEERDAISRQVKQSVQREGYLQELLKIG